MAEEQVKPKRTDEEEQDFLRDVQKKFREYKEAWRKQYELMEEDIAFCSPDNQWPAGVKQARIGKPTFAADRAQRPGEAAHQRAAGEPPCRPGPPDL